MKAIIFDVDGTLWDSTQVVAKAWNLALEETTTLDKRVTADELKGLFGRPLDEIVDALFPTLDTKQKKEIQQHLYEYEHDLVGKESCILYEGMIEGIKALSKMHPLFIVSNCQAGYIETFLKVNELEAYIKDYTCPGDTGLLKGENIKLIMKRNHLDTAVYVGDTKGDADACKIAGIPMIYASYGFGQVENPTYVIRKFSDLHSFDFDSI